MNTVVFQKILMVILHWGQISVLWKLTFGTSTKSVASLALVFCMFMTTVYSGVQSVYNWVAVFDVSLKGLVHNKNRRMSECDVRVIYQINTLLTAFFGGRDYEVCFSSCTALNTRIWSKRNKKSNSTENLPVNRRSTPSVTFKLYIPCIVNWCTEYKSKVIVKYIPYRIAHLLVLKEFVNQVLLNLVVSEIEYLHKKEIHVNLLRRKQKNLLL